MHRMGAQVHGLGANEPTCTPLATPLLYNMYYTAQPELLAEIKFSGCAKIVVFNIIG